MDHFREMNDQMNRIQYTNGTDEFQPVQTKGNFSKILPQGNN